MCGVALFGSSKSFLYVGAALGDADVLLANPDDEGVRRHEKRRSGAVLNEMDMSSDNREPEACYSKGWGRTPLLIALIV